jgi:hypothetical protein
MEHSPVYPGHGRLSRVKNEPFSHCAVEGWSRSEHFALPTVASRFRTHSEASQRPAWAWKEAPARTPLEHSQASERVLAPGSHSHLDSAKGPTSNGIEVQNGVRTGVALVLVLRHSTPAAPGRKGNPHNRRESKGPCGQARHTAASVPDRAGRRRLSSGRETRESRRDHLPVRPVHLPWHGAGSRPRRASSPGAGTA